MIALTTIPVLLLTWIAVENTRRSVEAQIVDANITRVRWAAQYIEGVLERFDDLFYSLQIDEDFVDILDGVEAAVATATSRTEAASRNGAIRSEGSAEAARNIAGSETMERELVQLLTTSYYSYSTMVDRLSVYIHATGRSIELDNVTSGRVTYPDLATSLWEGVLKRPIPLSIRRLEGELYALHTINRFMDQSFRGAMVAQLEEEFRKTVLEILASNGESAVYLLNDSLDVLVSSGERDHLETARSTSRRSSQHGPAEPAARRPIEPAQATPPTTGQIDPAQATPPVTGQIEPAQAESAASGSSESRKPPTTSPQRGPVAPVSAWLADERGNGSSPTVRETPNELVFYQSVRRGRLFVVKTVPLEIVTGSASDTVAAGLLTGGALVALSLVLSVLFSLRISRPIVQLANSMREATVPAFVDRHGQDRDEIRQLREGYETLIDRIKSLVQKEYEQEMELKDARLLALQAQINPHFLNNTLNLLGGMAVAKGVPEIYEIARAVGDMFRYAAEVDRDLVSLSQELAHARNYLLIQEHRFAGRCTTTVKVDMDVQGTRIPRFTLQPLVENAFEHGLQKQKGPWTVSIRGRRQRRGTIITVEDNGRGMEPEEVRGLRSRLADTDVEAETTHNIGLRNVTTRLRLHFGEPYGLRVFSIPGRGTRIVVVLPNRVPYGSDRRALPADDKTVASQGQQAAPTGDKTGSLNKAGDAEKTGGPPSAETGAGDNAGGRPTPRTGGSEHPGAPDPPGKV